MVFETKRLFLRELTVEDFSLSCTLLQDPEVMYAYEHAFSDEEVREWIGRMISRYREYGVGLWAVFLKETGEFAGQAGLTMQPCDGEQVLEIGYLLRRCYWGQGYAREAARGCLRYAAEVLDAQAVYCLIRDNNFASRRVALSLGMRVVKTVVKHYYGMDMPHLVYRLDLPGRDI